MGAVSIDTEKEQRSLDNKYDLYDKEGVKRLLNDYYYLQERMYLRGDFSASVLLMDLEKAIVEANLGIRQSQVIELWKLRYKQKEIAEELNITATTVKESLDSSMKKITNIFKKWGYFDDITY